jgi:quinol monooxygenase YgiN
MTVLLTRCRVADFDAWRPRFDAFASAQPAILSYRVWQGADDPNFVVLMETWASREAADAVLGDPRLQEVMVEDGVDLSSVTLDLLDEADDQ